MNPQKFEKLKDQIRGYIYFNCIKRGDFTLSSGIKTDTFIDLQEYPSLNPYVLDRITTALKQDILNRTKRNPFDIIVGVPHGGNLYAILVSQMLEKPFVYLKNKCEPAISWGTKPLGDQYKGFRNKRYILIEDVVTTGQSCRYIIDFLEQLNNKCIAVFSIILRDDININKSLIDVPLFSLFKYDGDLGDF